MLIKKYLQIFALGVFQFLQILIETEFCKFVLQMNPKVHVVNRMHDDVYELHARHHEFYVKTVVLREISHQRHEPALLRADLFEIIKR